MKMSIISKKSIKENSFLLKMILDLNKYSCEFQIVGDITEIYLLDDNMKIIEPVILHNKIYKYNELKELLNNNLYIIFLSIDIKRDDAFYERIDIYDVSYLDIKNHENDYERYTNYIENNTIIKDDFKYKLI